MPASLQKFWQGSCLPVSTILTICCQALILFGKSPDGDNAKIIYHSAFSFVKSNLRLYGCDQLLKLQHNNDEMIIMNDFPNEYRVQAEAFNEKH